MPDPSTASQRDERSPAIVEAWRRAWDTHDGRVFAALFTEDCAFEDIPFGFLVEGRDHVRTIVDTWTQICPDYRMDEADGFAANGQVAVRWRMIGTQTGAWAEMEATGRSFSVRGISILELDPSGLIRKETDVYDSRTLLQQLGHLPS